MAATEASFEQEKTEATESSGLSVVSVSSCSQRGGSDCSQAASEFCGELFVRSAPFSARQRHRSAATRVIVGAQTRTRIPKPRLRMCAGFAGRPIRCRRPSPAAVGELARWPATPLTSSCACSASPPTAPCAKSPVSRGPRVPAGLLRLRRQCRGQPAPDGKPTASAPSAVRRVRANRLTTQAWLSSRGRRWECGQFRIQGPPHRKSGSRAGVLAPKRPDQNVGAPLPSTASSQAAPARLASRVRRMFANTSAAVFPSNVARPCHNRSNSGPDRP